MDVRRFPGSRRHPHVGQDQLARWLPAAGISYRWMAALGGRRTPAADSPNLGLRNPQFRAYADHMASAEFLAAVDELLDLAASRPVAVMCSEAVWWRCHRRLLADHLVLVEGRRWSTCSTTAASPRTRSPPAPRPSLATSSIAPRVERPSDTPLEHHDVSGCAANVDA